jgi:hypothetical protein
MSGRGLLDADMATLARMAADGWRWWTGELAAMVPPAWRSGGRFPRYWLRGPALVPERAGRAAAGARVAVVLLEDAVLTRTIERPAAGPRDLRAMLAIEGDRLMPFGEEGGLVAGRAIGAGRVPGQMRVAVAGLPIATARTIAPALQADRLVAARVLVAGSAVDFAPALRAAGLLPRPGSAAPLLWAVVGFLLFLVLAATIWRDQARVDRLRGLVEAQQPAMAIAQQIGHRADAARRIAATLVAERRRHDVLGVLALTGEALPDQAWLQHFVWDGVEVRLTGYQPTGADVAAALRATRRFRQVQSNGDDAQNPVTGAAAFDLTARVRQ